MKPPVFAYHAPESLDAALALLAAQPNARVLAGGQSLLPMLNFRLLAPDHLVDIARIPDLAGIRVDDEGGDIVFGAMTRQREIEFSGLVARHLPLMAEAIRQVGHRQTRNRGTIGGSLCHLDPAAELPVVAMALDAVLTAASTRGRRAIPMAAFPDGMMTPSLEPDEMLVEIRCTPWPDGHGWAFEEFARRHGDFAIVAVACLLAAGADGRVARAAVALGGVLSTPTRITAAEQVLIGALPDAATLEAAARHCGEVDALEDVHAPAWYRQQVAVTLAGRALRRAAERLGTVATGGGR
jgi:carbon-monoxide dehydrogenase medium subunit